MFLQLDSILNILLGTLSFYINNVPCTAETELVRFLIYDLLHNEWSYTPSNLSDLSLHWNSSGDTKVLIHGYNFKPGHPKQFVFKKVTIIGQEYAKKDPSINNVLLDWYELATSPLAMYSKAVANTRKAGELLGDFLVKLEEEKFINDWSKVHLIGFSLGAHVAGFAGHRVQNKSRHKVGRISGIEPAGPGFQGNGFKVSTEDIVDSTDADYVDIMHCNMESGNIDHIAAGVLGSFGTTVQSGHSDFYINGGMRQEAQCTLKQDILTGCSHLVCPLVFALSITTQMRACRCNSWNNFISGNCPCSSESETALLGDSSARSKAEGKYFIKLDKVVTEDMFS